MVEKLKLLGYLVAIEHTIFSGMFILIALVVAGLQTHLGLLQGVQTLLLSALALLFARNFAMGFNRLADRKFDMKTSAPKVAQAWMGAFRSQLCRCSVWRMRWALWVSAMPSMPSLLNSLGPLAILAGYSYMKRFSYLAHLVLGVCLGLAPIAGVVAVLGAIPLWSLWLAFGVAFWVAGFDLLYSLQDMEFDRKEGLYSVPAIFGEG
ncbi:hypothetical protein NHP190003_02790 [Helicobacter sp. NHP19-003]|uniref:4-hydroxybenzoate polyprenyltransferase n=1 Tax=Helicobacter gastrocanis TaxID=2849641 RepID=A0ABM7SBE0_9HELI|nr:UbiA family prenyltransferase [Helicobacter sp. NHP19-003]BCZ16997.1 hypothetical protein NHP190003_02790 [Helicobacter sp. NHP19-003]